MQTLEVQRKTTVQTKSTVTACKLLILYYSQGRSMYACEPTKNCIIEAN